MNLYYMSPRLENPRHCKKIKKQKKLKLLLKKPYDTILTLNFVQVSVNFGIHEETDFLGL